jgi:hypothetical protein
MSFSEELKDLCLATEGKQIEITYDLETFAYSKETGRQQLRA